MKLPLLIVGLIAYACGTAAQNVHTVTTLVIAGSVTNAVGGLDYVGPFTNSVVIPNGQAARVAAIRPRPSTDGTQESEWAWFDKAGVSFLVGKGDVVAGPAVFYLRNGRGLDAMLTLERWTVKKTRVP